MRLFLILCFFLSLIYFQCYGQEQWSLEKCISYALENNVQIKQQALKADYSGNTLKQSKLGLLPTINGYTNQQYNFGRAVDPFTNTFTDNNVNSSNFSIATSVTLFKGFQNLNSIKRNQYDLQATIQDVQAVKNDVSLSIAAAYLQILFNKELVEIAKNQLKITQQQVDRTSKLVEAGSLAQGSFLEIEAQAAAEELQVVNAENQLKMSYLTLSQLLELETAVGFAIVEPEMPEIKEETIGLNLDRIFADAMAVLPQIKSAELRYKSAGKSLAISKGTRSPSLSVSSNLGSGYSSSIENYKVNDTVFSPMLSGYTSTGDDVYTYSYNVDYDRTTRPFADQFKDNQSLTLSFNLSIPIFNGWQANTAISNSKINVLNYQYQLESEKNKLYKEIQQAYADAEGALKKFHATNKAVMSIDEAFRYTQQKFSVGLVNSVDFNVAKNQLTKTKSDLLQAKYEYIFKIKILDFYMGNPIKL